MIGPHQVRQAVLGQNCAHQLCLDFIGQNGYFFEIIWFHDVYGDPVGVESIDQSVVLPTNLGVKVNIMA